MDTFARIHGTTVDKFQIGTKSQRITLSGTTTGSNNVDLLDREGEKYTADSTVFFTAYILGQGSDVFAAEIKGCYINGVPGVSGTVVNVYIDSFGFVNPTIFFTNSGTMTVNCTGILGQNINWSATIDLLKI